MISDAKCDSKIYPFQLLRGAGTEEDPDTCTQKAKTCEDFNNVVKCSIDEITNGKTKGCATIDGKIFEYECIDNGFIKNDNITECQECYHNLDCQPTEEKYCDSQNKCQQRLKGGASCQGINNAHACLSGSSIGDICICSCDDSVGCIDGYVCDEKAKTIKSRKSKYK